MATTGCMPPIARPAAEVIACCSAIPTSKNRSGYLARNALRPVGPGIAAVIATTSRRSDAIWMSVSENVAVQPGPGTDRARPVSGSMTPQACIWSSSSFSAGA